MLQLGRFARRSRRLLLGGKGLPQWGWQRYIRRVAFRQKHRAHCKERRATNREREWVAESRECLAMQKEDVPRNNLLRERDAMWRHDYRVLGRAYEEPASAFQRLPAELQDMILFNMIE